MAGVGITLLSTLLVYSMAQKLLFFLLRASWSVEEYADGMASDASPLRVLPLVANGISYER